MTRGVIPGRRAIVTLGAVSAALLVALIAGVAVVIAAWIAVAAVVGLTLAAVYDYVASRRAWRNASPRMKRLLPSAFAVGVRRPITISIDMDGHDAWRCSLYDHADATLVTTGLPTEVTLVPQKQIDTTYTVTPGQRGEVTFAPAEVRVRSRWGLCELLEQLGSIETRRVYPDFAQIARYAWLAGDRRLQEIGIKTYQRRGQGTDFKQLSEYNLGDSVRHIDWRATLRMGKPIVREFQDERDQCVMLLVDCGRRMRADDRDVGSTSTHFDQVLNAVMLVSYVALKQGDEVGAMTFGTPADLERSVPPRKGAQALNTMMSHLHGIQPTPTHSDYVAAAQSVLRRHHKRSLVIVITNFRDEDSTELRHALRLLRSRHLVLLASVRERIVDELMGQPLTSGEAALDVASAHLYEQSRRDAFNRLATGEGLMVDATPESLGVALVNRYHALKRAGRI
jgi:uncharacterized protein (DUF58 family)